MFGCSVRETERGMREGRFFTFFSGPRLQVRGDALEMFVFVSGNEDEPRFVLDPEPSKHVLRALYLPRPRLSRLVEKAAVGVKELARDAPVASSDGDPKRSV